MTNNLQRCQRARAALDPYRADEPNRDSNVIDLLTDLRHYCDLHDFDIESFIHTSEMHHAAESILE